MRAVKEACPDLLVITDVCLCEYTDHGHCGVLGVDGTVRNDETLERYATIAVAEAEAGVDVVAPSGMMDGQVGVIRAALDELADFGRPARIMLAVLIDRGGRELPIHADVVGRLIDVPRGGRVDVGVMELDGRDEVTLTITADAE